MSIIERALQKAQAQAKLAASAEASTQEARLQGAVSQNVPDDKSGPNTELGRDQAPLVVPTPTSNSLPLNSPQTNSAAEDYSSRITALDLKKIVEIDFEALRNLGRLPSLASSRQTEEDMRRIKWPLLSAIAGRGGVPAARNNVILITSAEPSEGKSFTSLNLALSIVRDREMRVILVDGDVARPGLTPALGLEGAPGLTNVLDNTAMDVNEITYRTTVDGLFFVPAGKWHEHSPELIAGSRMPQIIEDLGRRVGVGVVVLDSPPLLASNEAQAATRFVGHVLLVVRADWTEQRAVLDALKLIEKSTPVSAVLNGVETSSLSRYYGQYSYGYGTQHGSYYGRGPKAGAG